MNPSPLEKAGPEPRPRLDPSVLHLSPGDLLPLQGPPQRRGSQWEQENWSSGNVNTSRWETVIMTLILKHGSWNRPEKKIEKHDVVIEKVVGGFLAITNHDLVTYILVRSPQTSTVFQGTHLQPLRPLRKNTTITAVLTTTPTHSKMLKCFPWKFWSSATLLEKELMERWQLTTIVYHRRGLLTVEPQVYRGYIQYPNYKVEVAIKTCKRSNGYDDIEREARVFMKLKERNMNIVNLLGEK